MRVTRAQAVLLVPTLLLLLGPSPVSAKESTVVVDVVVGGGGPIKEILEPTVERIDWLIEYAKSQIPPDFWPYVCPGTGWYKIGDFPVQDEGYGYTIHIPTPLGYDGTGTTSVTLTYKPNATQECQL